MKILPAYPNREAAAKITVQQLLEHQAGVVDIFDVLRDAPSPPASNHEWYALVAPRPLLFAPGSQTRYCNGCYVVLGEIVAALSGTSYESYLATHVLAPAGMRDTAFLGGDVAEPRKARGYTRRGAGLELASLGKGGRGSGAGGIFATAADLLAFDNALRTYRLVDRERTSWVLSGGDVTGSRAHGGLAIAGGTPGTNALLDSDGTWTVVVLTNRDPRLAETLGTAIARELRR
jgi:CubicO group peptidase (beta-lactamase class C family)